MIWIVRNGCRVNKSLSPEIMQFAFPEIANSRNLLSLGSRHSETSVSGLINSPICTNIFIKAPMAVDSTNSVNFGFNRVFLSSMIVVSEKSITCYFAAIRTTLFANSLLKTKALTKIFVSSIRRIKYYNLPNVRFISSMLISKMSANFSGERPFFFAYSDDFSITERSSLAGSEAYDSTFSLNLSSSSLLIRLITSAVLSLTSMLILFITSFWIQRYANYCIEEIRNLTAFCNCQLTQVWRII